MSTKLACFLRILKDMSAALQGLSQVGAAQAHPHESELTQTIAVSDWAAVRGFVGDRD